MANQLTLAFTVNVAGTSYGPTQAAQALLAVPLYVPPGATDPVLGQLGLTVASDSLSETATTATRTLVFNMTSANSPAAPPVFPCHPLTATPPAPPYPLLQSTNALPGSFLTVPRSTSVMTSASQVPSLVAGAIVQFMAQPGVFYTLASNPISGSIALTTPYSGPFVADGGAVEMVPAPSTITAIYSTSDLDSDGVTITPPLPPGSGAQFVRFTYLRPDGSGPFTTTVALMGKFPVLASVDSIATILTMEVFGTGAFENSVGQITLCELSAVPPAIPADATAQEFQELTDQAQMLITRGLAYLPPSFFALAQQGNSFPQLAGEFTLTQDSPSVPTSEDLTGVLTAGNVIQFAAQMSVDTPFGAIPLLYTVASISPKLLVLTTPWTGLNDNSIESGGFLVTPTGASPPTAAELETLVGEFVNPGTAIPPPNPPLAPQTMSPSPAFLSGLFARTLQLALAVPVVPSPVVLS